MSPPLTIWDSQADDDDPIAYIYDAAGVIQQRIYRQHTGADVGRKIVWFCTCLEGNQWPLQRCDHLRRFMEEATAGRLGPGIMLTHHGREVADTSCKCNTGRQLEESPRPERPRADRLTSKERRAVEREEKRLAWEARERERLEREQADRDAFETAESERHEAEQKAVLEAQWRARFDERTRMARARIAQIEAEIAAERAAEEKARPKRRKKNSPKAPSKTKPKAPAKKIAPTAKKAPAKKIKAKPKKRGKR